MPSSEFIRSARSGPVVAAVAFGLIGFANLSFGAAIVGEMRRTEPSPKTAVAIGAMKAEYRRPAVIPFPKENPYTPDKASLGKKLYFDTRISVTSAQSCASCHSPGFGWGDGLAVGVGHGMAKRGRQSPAMVNAAWGAIFMWDGRPPVPHEDRSPCGVDDGRRMATQLRHAVADADRQSVAPTK